MEEIKRTMTLAPNEYYAKHLELMSSLLPTPLTGKEISILSKFMAFEGPLVSDYRFNSIVRAKVREESNASPGNMANYLKSIKKKGYISKDVEGRISIHPKLWPSTTQEYNITLIKNGSKTN